MIGGRNKQRTCEKFRRNSNRGRRCIVWLIVVSLLVNMPLCTYAFGMNEGEISGNEIGGSVIRGLIWQSESKKSGGLKSEIKILFFTDLHNAPINELR